MSRFGLVAAAALLAAGCSAHKSTIRVAVPPPPAPAPLAVDDIVRPTTTTTTTTIAPVTTTTTVKPLTSIASPVKVTTTTTAQVRKLPAASTPTTTSHPVATAAANQFTCAWALAYLAANAAPGFVASCPAWAGGHQAETCLNHPPECSDSPPGNKQIHIWVVCPASVMNEAWNSWHIYAGGPYDPYGYCH